MQVMLQHSTNFKEKHLSVHCLFLSLQISFVAFHRHMSPAVVLQVCVDKCPTCRLVLKDVVKTHTISVLVDTSYEDFHGALQVKGSKQIADIKEPMR